MKLQVGMILIEDIGFIGDETIRHGEEFSLIVADSDGHVELFFGEFLESGEECAVVHTTICRTSNFGREQARGLSPRRVD